MAKINPFRPNSPVNPGMFVGRVKEITRLDSHLIQARAGQPTNFLITGERGIGKSSLMLYITFVARGEIPINGETLHFLVAFTDIDKTTSQLGLVRKIELAIRQEIHRDDPSRQLQDKAWGFIKRLEAAGVRLHPDEDEKPDDLLLEESAYALAETVNRLCAADAGAPSASAKYDGLLLLIDEADNAESRLDLGAFLKLTLERVQRHGCTRLIVGVSGLPVVRDVLLDSHPSSLRIFDELTLQRLTQEEVTEVIDTCISRANTDNDIQTAIDDEAKQDLAAFSEGYPHFVQQFGFSAFAADTDDVIGEDDVYAGGFGKGGALELIGDRYYRDSFYNKIQAESYRQVLRIMADKLDGWVTKEEIKRRFKGKDTVLNNALKALRDRKIILPMEGKPGVYRLQHKGFALWIKLYTSDREGLIAAKEQMAANPVADVGSPRPDEEPMGT